MNKKLVLPMILIGYFVFMGSIIFFMFNNFYRDIKEVDIYMTTNQRHNDDTLTIEGTVRTVTGRDVFNEYDAEMAGIFGGRRVTYTGYIQTLVFEDGRVMQLRE